MNIRHHQIEIQCSQRDTCDVAQAIVHSLIFFRTHGKFNYKHEGSYSIGTLGYEMVNCNHLDFSYIRGYSPSLIGRVDGKIREFVSKFTENTHSGTLAVEFYTKRHSRWPFNDSKIVWELWNIKLVIIPHNSALVTSASDQNHHQNRQHHQHQQRFADTTVRIEDVLSLKILDIVRTVNSDSCSLPQMPTQPNLDSVFDTSHNELQPYLHNISYKINESATSSQSGGGTAARCADGNVVTDSSTQSTLKKFLLNTLEL